jgi:hypothetical protein
MHGKIKKRLRATETSCQLLPTHEGRFRNGSDAMSDAAEFKI